MKHKLFILFFLIISICAAILLAGGIAMYVYVQRLPSVADAQTRTLAFLHTHKGEYVTMSSRAKVSEAIVAIEDRRFYQHHGIDAIGFLKTALLDQFTSYPNGGATIDEQLAKNIYVMNDVSWRAKVEVVGLAIKLDMVYSKQQILSMYLNAIYYGDKKYGVEQASEGYFHEMPNQLSWAQASMLAGLPQAPSYYDPYKNMPAARLRQKLVLEALVRNGTMSASTSTSIYNTPIILAK